MDDLDLVIEAACRLPLDYEQLGVYSAVEILRRSGFPGRRSEIDAERLRSCLASHSDLVRAWLEWPDGNFSTPAWYVRECDPARFELRFGDALHGVFEDRVTAAAELAIRELASIADLA